MRSYVDDPRVLAELHACAGMLRTNAALRENIQLALAALNDDSHADMADFAFGDPPRAVSHPGLLLLWSVFCVVTLVAAILSAWLAWILVGTFAINVLIMARTFGSLRRDTEVLKHCLGMLPVAAALSRISVMACIRSEHSGESGKSHYFGEIERLRSFIECAGRGACRIFIIDELFSGTNTVERIAIARARHFVASRPD